MVLTSITIVVWVFFVLCVFLKCRCRRHKSFRSETSCRVSSSSSSRSVDIYSDASHSQLSGRPNELLNSSSIQPSSFFVRSMLCFFVLFLNDSPTSENGTLVYHGLLLALEQIQFRSFEKICKTNTFRRQPTNLDCESLLVSIRIEDNFVVVIYLLLRF